MALVNVPIVNSTLINAELLQKRKECIISDCELLRREFEVYGIELSDQVLDMYRKAVIVASANVVWDLKATSFRGAHFQNYTNGTYNLQFQPRVYQVPIGIKSVDPITLSFMTIEEFKSIVNGHLKALWPLKAPYMNYTNSSQLDPHCYPIFDNKTPDMHPFSHINDLQIEANYQSLYGAFDFKTYSSSVAKPANTERYVNMMYEINRVFAERTYITKLFQNPSLQFMSLIPMFKFMYERNPYNQNGIPFKTYYDYDKIHFASLEKYFEGFTNGIQARSRLTGLGLLLSGLTGYTRNDTLGSFSNGRLMSHMTVNPASVAEWNNAGIRFQQMTYEYTAAQKAFTYSTMTTTQLGNYINTDPVSQTYRRALAYKQLVDSKGGSPSLIVNLFRIIAEAHASIMTTINILNYDFIKQFKQSLVIENADGSIRDVYIFLNNNFRVEYYKYNKSYSGGGDIHVMYDGPNAIRLGSTIASVKVVVPVDPSQPFPYYHITPNGTTPTHMVKITALLGIQKLRNGFLYQDIERNFDPTFVNFDNNAITQLESLVSKQVAMYDLLEDVKSGTIFTKVITESVQKVPFNPSMPEYVTKTTYVDYMKTSEGEMPIIHPDNEQQIKWTQIHAEMVVQSSFYYHKFIQAVTPLIDQYNQRVSSYISKITAEMKTLSMSYVATEAAKLKAEMDRTKMEIALEKLKSGVFINDNGVEYWRKLLPEEVTAMNEMIAKIEANIAQEDLNAEIAVKNALRQKEVDEAQIKANDEAQRLADMRQIELNKQYQAQVDAQVVEANRKAQEAADERMRIINQTIFEEDSQWKRDNIDNVKCPTYGDLNKIATENDTCLSDALIIWENNHPYYSYNGPLLLEVEALRNDIIQLEIQTAEKLIYAKTQQAKMAEAIMKIFPDKF